MKIFSPFSLLAILVLTAIGCKKKDDPAPVAAQTKTELLTASSWKVDAAGLDQDRNGTIDLSLMTAIPVCTTDNTILFKTNNTGVTDEGAAKCNATDAQTSNFNWAFADAETNITVSNSTLTPINGKSKVLVLSATALTLSKDTTLAPFGNVALVVNLKH